MRWRVKRQAAGVGRGCAPRRGGSVEAAVRSRGHASHVHEHLGGSATVSPFRSRLSRSGSTNSWVHTGRPMNALHAPMQARQKGQRRRACPGAAPMPTLPLPPPSSPPARVTACPWSDCHGPSRPWRRGVLWRALLVGCQRGRFVSWSSLSSPTSLPPPSPQQHGCRMRGCWRLKPRGELTSLQLRGVGTPAPSHPSGPTAWQVTKLGRIARATSRVKGRRAARWPPSEIDPGLGWPPPADRGRLRRSARSHRACAAGPAAAIVRGGRRACMFGSLVDGARPSHPPATPGAVRNAEKRPPQRSNLPHLAAAAVAAEAASKGPVPGCDAVPAGGRSSSPSGWGRQ